MKPPRAHGFTLIEVIVALAIFAIVATLSSSVLIQAFHTRTHLAAMTERTNTLQLAVTLIRRDLLQVVNRSIRGPEMHLFPPFIGESNYTEFTRGGFVNPNAATLSTTLKRVALLCNEKQLVRRSWLTLDGPSHKDFQDRVLLDHITHCSFSYLSRSREMLPSWRPYALQQNQKNQSIPMAIQLSLTRQGLGEMTLIFIIPEALYGE
jgi:general secretion pathway protein J